MKLKPIGDRVVLKQLEAESTTASGIVLPTQSKEKPQEAEVVSVGDGVNEKGVKIDMNINIGDKVIYSKYSGTDVKIDKEEFIIVKYSDILAIVE